MEHSRRSFLAKSLILSSGVLSGCMGDKLTAHMFYPREYTDDFSLWISEDKKKLVLIGKKFHYIFESDQELFQDCVDRDPDHNEFTDPYWSLYVDANNNASLKYELRYLKVGNRHSSISGKLHGKRYQPVDESIHTKVAGLETSYAIQVREELKPTDKILPTLISPVTLTIDGVLCIAQGFLYAFVIVLLMFNNVSFSRSP